MRKLSQHVWAMEEATQRSAFGLSRAAGKMAKQNNLHGRGH
jgi:hypothetical protein